MPVVKILKKELDISLGKIYSKEEFEDLCFRYGVELDDITSEYDEMLAQKGQGDHLNGLSKDIIYKVDIPSNRYDLLCLEGLGRAFRVFLGDEKTPEYKTYVPTEEKILKMNVKSSVNVIRPFVVCAVLRGINFTESTMQHFIDLQTKFHENACRRRTLVAIGTHDLDMIKGPFTYIAKKPSEISFVPLNKDKVYTADELLEYYEKTGESVGAYNHIIKDSDVYPVIYDSTGTVLSLPPIINGEHSKITLKTRNIFIECTCTDLTRGKIVINNLVGMFSEYCSNKFTVEAVQVNYQDVKKESYLSPFMKNNVFTADPERIAKRIGINIGVDRITSLLNSMQLPARFDKKSGLLIIQAPPTRSDVLHEVDIIEDVAIAYGYDNIKKTVPATTTVAKPQLIGHFTDHLRHICARAGYLEVLNWALCSHDENYKFLNRVDNDEAVLLSNGKSFDIVRTSLLPGIFQVLKQNMDESPPINLFEVSDVVVVDKKTDTGARNKRHLAAVICNLSDSLENIHGLLDKIMEGNGIKFKYDDKVEDIKQEEHVYELKNSTNPTFMKGRAIDVYYNDVNVGVFGIIHPNVLKSFSIKFPVSAIELNVQELLKANNKK